MQKSSVKGERMEEVAARELVKESLGVLLSNFGALVFGFYSNMNQLAPWCVDGSFSGFDGRGRTLRFG